MTTPQYQITDDMPVMGLEGAGMLYKGSIIETDNEPGPHMIPLNPEAEAAMEAFYTKEFEYDFYNKETGQTERRKHRPRLGLRPPPDGAPAKVGPVRMIAPPETDNKPGLTLAELAVSAVKPGGPIPPPDPARKVRKEFVTKAEPAPSLAEAEAVGIKVASAAKPDPVGSHAKSTITVK